MARSRFDAFISHAGKDGAKAETMNAKHDLALILDLKRRGRRPSQRRA